MCVFFFRQKTSYEMRISDWSSDVCSSDLPFADNAGRFSAPRRRHIGKIGPGEEAQRRIGLKPGYQPAYCPDAWEQTPTAIELDGIDPPRRRISCILPIQQCQGDVVTIAPFSRRVQQCRHDSLSAATGKRIDDEERLFLQCGHLFGEPGAYTILMTHDLGRWGHEGAIDFGRAFRGGRKGVV